MKGTQPYRLERMPALAWQSKDIVYAVFLLDSSPSFLHSASHLRLRMGQMNHPTTKLSTESITPSPLFGDGPIIFANSSEEAIESLQMIKSPFLTAAIIREATFSEEGKRDLSSEIEQFVPCIRLVSSVFVSCSRRNPGEIKSAGKAQ